MITSELMILLTGYRFRDSKKFSHVNRLSAKLPKTSRKPLNNLIGLWSKSINMANDVIPAYHGVRGLTKLMKKYTGNTEQFVQFPYTSLKEKAFSASYFWKRFLHSV
jgi:hypothetical protein